MGACSLTLYVSAAIARRDLGIFEANGHCKLTTGKIYQVYEPEKIDGFRNGTDADGAAG